jgi:hypothetical protein
VFTPHTVTEMHVSEFSKMETPKSLHVPFYPKSNFGLLVDSSSVRTGTARFLWYLKCLSGSWRRTEAGNVFGSDRLFSDTFIFRIWLSPWFYIAVSTWYNAYSRCGRRLCIYSNYDFYWIDCTFLHTARKDWAGSVIQL